MRKALLLAAILLCLCLPVWSEAQSCDGCGIGYHPPSVSPSGGTFTGPILLPDGSAAAPSLAFSGATGTGFWRTGSFLSWSIAGALRGAFNQANIDQYSDTASLRFGASSDVVLTRDAANTLALRNSTAAQTFNIYNTWTDASNYERGGFAWAGNQMSLTTSAAGSGTARPLLIDSGNVLYINDNPLPYSDDLYSLGSSSIRWISAYVSRSIQGSKSKALTDNTATAFVRLSVADDDYEGCGFVWTAYAEDADGDARQTRTGRNHVAILNNSGTETAAFSTGDSAVVVTGGTFTCTFDGNSGAADTIDLRATCDTSLDAAAETLTFEYRLDCPSTVTLTPQ